MAMEIVELYISHLSTFFGLSDPSLDAPRKQNEEARPLPSFVPLGTTVLTACHFGEKLVLEVYDGITDLMGVNVGGESGSGLKSMLEALRSRFQGIISTSWARGMSLAHFRCS